MVLDLVKKMFRVLAMSKKIFKILQRCGYFFYKGVVTFFFMCIHMILFLMTAIFLFCCFQETNSITCRDVSLASEKS